MKFMIIGKGSAETEAGAMPSPQLVDDMTAYNESLVRAGVLLAAEGLHPSSRAARIVYGPGKPKVVDGPFAETKEIIAGFWLIQVKSREEAVEWALRVPVPEGGEGVGLELWQVFDIADMPETSLSPETARRESAVRESLENPGPDA
ncbi:YciI family protein [Nonomuraea sp. MCN248]|uniref:YciI family protein n=1 Tax=Nonomuraea corallina TaxID=2989783 RepID=A0ABT4SI22_9ACTN|nr:YciI family protein [Nonomuraea corallina]MDA0636581.1 YciI family protein [Nonomuraea corallina]